MWTRRKGTRAKYLLFALVIWLRRLQADTGYAWRTLRLRRNAASEMSDIACMSIEAA